MSEPNDERRSPVQPSPDAVAPLADEVAEGDDLELETSSDGDASDIRRLLRQVAAEEVDTPDLLPGVQRELRERSGGRFYADGWSTVRHPPVATYLVTGALMSLALLVVWALLSVIEELPTPPTEPEPVLVVPRG